MADGDGGTLGLPMTDALVKVEEGWPVPDLLAKDASVRVDTSILRQALVFAFAMGGSVETFDRALATATLPASTWSMADFSRDLFLDDLVKRARAIKIGERLHQPAAAYLLRAIAQPPSDLEVVAFRRAILAEVDESAKLRRAVESTYQEL